MTAMKNKILNWLDTTAGRLIFALASGAAYYMLILRAILQWSRGLFIIAGYLMPLIVCGAAIIIIKLMKQAKENENPAAIWRLFVMHVFLIVAAICTTITYFV